MLTIPISLNDRPPVLIVILEDENLQRIKQKDPAIVHVKSMPGIWQRVCFEEIHILYASPTEAQAIQSAAAIGDSGKAMQLTLALESGFKFQPERGDSDEPYKRL